MLIVSLIVYRISTTSKSESGPFTIIAKECSRVCKNLLSSQMHAKNIQPSVASSRCDLRAPQLELEYKLELGERSSQW